MTRTEGSPLAAILAFLAAFFAALATVVLILAFSADDPGAALIAFFAKPFGTWWRFGNLLNTAALYMIAGTGSALALKAGTFNLGGEAQIYAPALVTAVALPAFSPALPPPIALLCALVLAVFSGALLGFFPGLLRAKRGASELLTSFLLSAACVPVVDYLIGGPLRDRSNNLLATPLIPESARLGPFVPPSWLNASFPAAIALALAAAYFLRMTGPGFSYRLSGKAPEFARFSGFPVENVAIAGMTVSGALHGVAGFAAVTGTWYRCHQGFSAGMGWSALAVALIAKSDPLAVIPAALLLAWLQSASDSAMLATRLGFDATALIQAVLFLLVSARFLPVLIRLPSLTGLLRGRTKGGDS